MPLAPTKIKLDAGDNTLAIEWSDGHASAYGYEYLRDHCPCATCTGAEGRTPRTRAAVSGPLPMYRPAPRPLRAELVGRYALQIFWSDGHSTGIYTFTYLREVCPCATCVEIGEKRTT